MFVSQQSVTWYLRHYVVIWSLRIHLLAFLVSLLFSFCVQWNYLKFQEQVGLCSWHPKWFHSFCQRLQGTEFDAKSMARCCSRFLLICLIAEIPSLLSFTVRHGTPPKRKDSWDTRRWKKQQPNMNCKHKDIQMCWSYYLQVENKN